MMNVNIIPFGEVGNHSVELINISNDNGTKISVTNYGCIITSIVMRDKNNNFNDIVFGFDCLESYLVKHPFFGAVVGRFANRIENASFSVGNEKYELEKNERITNQHIHGGYKGFDKYIWSYDIEEKENCIKIHFHRVSIDGESGYPGNLLVEHIIGLDNDDNIYLDFSAITDKTTIINLTNHSYYNLAGHNAGSIESHNLKLFSDFYTPTTDNIITTGEVKSVLNTGLDFRKPVRIRSNMDKLPNGEIDHNFILRGDIAFDNYKKAAELYEPNSGRMMKVLTTQPAIQIYNASKLSNGNWIGKDNVQYHSFSGICFETQHYPNSTKYAHFPSVFLEPNMIYRQKTIFSFSIKY